MAVRCEVNCRYNVSKQATTKVLGLSHNITNSQVSEPKEERVSGKCVDKIYCMKVRISSKHRQCHTIQQENMIRGYKTAMKVTVS